MNLRGQFIFVASLALVTTAGTGCRRNIVQAEPPSVVSMPSVEPLPAPEPPARTAESTPAPVPEPGVAPPPPADVSAEPAPPKPRPAPVEAEAPKAKIDDVPPPAIVPQLSARQQAAATHATSNSMQSAKRNLQAVSGKQLKPSQKDMVDKIQGFLTQADSAIRSGDWLRAQDLAHKAEVLSVELNRSF
jgi:outer membrane biosynthesis protein TonB